MHLSIRDKLNRIYGSTETGDALRSQLERLTGSQNPNSIATYLGGEWVEQPDGRVLRVRRSWPASYRHGGISLSQLYSVDSQSVGLLAGSGDFRGFDPDRTVFLDTETTGLAGGAGTCVFLVGIGFFEDAAFRIQQYFLSSYDAERVFLEEIQEMLFGASRFKYLVSFNGKSYDLNLLDNRFVMQRLQPSFGEFEHLDLLHPSRLLWRGCFANCALQTLERNLLGLRRHGDIPSAMIPRVYFDYVRSGRFDLFDRVFEHNRIDLLTMVSLVTLAARVVVDPDTDFHSDWAATSRLHEIRGNLPKAEELLETAQQKSNPPDEVLLRLASLKKRLGKTEEALCLFLRLVESDRSQSIRPHVEAAKILEHEKKDFYGALALVEKALQLQSSVPLQHRRHRLQCRLDGVRWY